MNMAYRTARPDDMPLHGRIIREGKGKYAVIITFAKSRRHYEDEVVHAPNQKAVKAKLLRLYPTITFGKRR